jgi:hypothetical protein
LFLTDEQIRQFFNGSSPFITPSDNTFSNEIDRLNDLINSLREEQENRNEGLRLDEHPIIPNGTFLRSSIRKNVINYYYIQQGLLRKFDKKSTFESLFQSITNLNPTKKDNLDNYAPFVDDVGIVFINSFPKGRDITEESLGSETNETDISIADDSGNDSSEESSQDNNSDNNSENENGNGNQDPPINLETEDRLSSPTPDTSNPPPVIPPNGESNPDIEQPDEENNNNRSLLPSDNIFGF